MLPRHARCVFYRRCCNGYSILLNFCSCRIDKIENPLCSACGHPIQDTSHLILHCPATDFLSRSLFGNFFYRYDLWYRLWRVAWLLGLHGFSHAPTPRKRSGSNNKSSCQSDKLLYFLLLFPADLICIQEFNLNSSSPFRIPRYSALQSD